MAPMRVINLGGDWQATEIGKEAAIPATVPGCIHTDLLAAGEIADPFCRDNETDVQWIGETDWLYERRFTVSPELLDEDRVVLRCEGLDTLATLTLNGREIGSTDNMFRTWEFDVKDGLRAGENALAIRFASTLPFIRNSPYLKKVKDWPKGAADRCGLSDVGRGSTSFVRKEPCNFGWDWGPTLITCGVWRPIHLIAFSQARLSDVHITQEHGKKGRAQVGVTLAAEKAKRAGGLKYRIAIVSEGETVARKEGTLSGKHAEARLSIPRPRLWWPNGLGEQPLYEVTVDLLDEHAQPLDRWSRRIGLRTLNLVHKPDEWGESFYFVVNGIPFFAKGADWIPADTFATRLTRGDYARLLGDCRQANMNMLRVWGGGIYESDDFYDLCDELGLCVWQDFIFACATYPYFDKVFLKSVEAEAEDNVRRLRHHSCLALWCGNNEMDAQAASKEWGEGYKTLFDKVLPRVIRRLDPQRDYWPASPHTPSRKLRANDNNPDYGDAHTWEVWHGRKPFEWYRTSTHRFCSEFGFQSFPDPKTVHGYTLPRDRNITSPVMEHHQRSGSGNAVIMTYMLDWFRLPRSFEMTLWLSQIQHGMSMKYAVEHWRRNMPRTMGTLYWQLNDCWPVASWASIDYHGRWKALHYMARDFFAPLLVSGVEHPEDGTVEVFVSSDLLDARSGSLVWMVTDVAGRSLRKGEKTIRVAPRKSARVENLALKDLLAQQGARDLMVWLELMVEGQCVSRNFVTFAKPKKMELLPPEIVSMVEKDPGGSYSIALEAKAPALWTWLELEGMDARISDNFFHLRPGWPITIKMWPHTDAPLEQVRSALRAYSLIDTYTQASATD